MSAPLSPATHAPRGPWLRERRRPERISRSARAPWLAVTAVCLGALLGQLNSSIVTVALPTLRRTFHTTAGRTEWVALAYLLTLVTLVTVAGRLADAYGRKALYLQGFALFTLASVGCALAPNLLVLDLLRAVQGVGAAFMQANSVALIATSVPEAMLGRAIGVQGAAQAVGLAAGPTIGGLLLAVGGWRLIFAVNVPLGVIGVVAGIVFLPRSRNLTDLPSFDWWGLAAYVPTVALLMLGLSVASEQGQGLRSIIYLVLSGLCAVAFVRRQRRAAHPLVDPGLVSRRRFRLRIATGFLGYLALFGLLFVCPFLLEGTFHLPVARAGLVLTALPVAMAVMAPPIGRVLDRRGPRTPTVAGLSLAAATFAIGAIAPVTVASIVVLLVVAGIGMGAFLPANNTAVMMSVPLESSGAASGLLNASRGIGTAVGVAAAGLLIGRVAGHPATAAGLTLAFRWSLVLFAVILAVAAALTLRRAAQRP